MGTKHLTWCALKEMAGAAYKHGGAGGKDLATPGSHSVGSAGYPQQWMCPSPALWKSETQHLAPVT